MQWLLGYGRIISSTTILFERPLSSVSVWNSKYRVGAKQELFPTPPRPAASLTCTRHFYNTLMFIYFPLLT